MTNADFVYPQAFVLERLEDVSGVSGTGIVAWGVKFPDGVVALRWNSAWPTSVVFHDRGMEAVEAVHGHQGRTQVVWVDTHEHAWLRVVGAKGTDDFWWVCDRCPDVSEVKPTPQAAYGLALGHADWHRMPHSEVGWGGPVTPCVHPDNGSSGS